MSKKIQKPFDIARQMYPELPCFDGADDEPVIDDDYIRSLQEGISLWKYVIAHDIADGNMEMAKMDKRQLQQVKIEYRNAKLMMQNMNGMEAASA